MGRADGSRVGRVETSGFFWDKTQLDTDPVWFLVEAPSVSEDVKPRSSEHGQSGEGCQELETLDTTGRSVQLWKDGRRSHKIHRLG